MLPAASATLEVVVDRVIDTAVDIRLLELVDPRGAALAPFSAGSHIDVHLGDALVRQYSLCNDPEETHRYQLGVLRTPAGRGGSAAVHRLRAGDRVRISAPRNHFPLVHGAAHSVLLAGGIGITPLLCMAERLARSGASFALHYAARSRDRAAFLERIASSAFADRVTLHFDDGPPEQRLRFETVLAGGVGPDHHLYVCGPPGFIDAALAAASAQGWPSAQTHTEFFEARALPAAAAGGDQPFELLLASTGKVIPVAADQTAAEALHAAGVPLPMSCEQGICGTCAVRVLEGEPEHRDLYMSDEEHAQNTVFTPCCSRSRSARLVLDL